MCTMAAIRSEDNRPGWCRKPSEWSKRTTTSSSSLSSSSSGESRGVKLQHIIREHVDKSAGARKSEGNRERRSLRHACRSVSDDRCTSSLRSPTRSRAHPLSRFPTFSCGSSSAPPLLLPPRSDHTEIRALLGREPFAEIPGARAPHEDRRAAIINQLLRSA